MDEKVRVAAYCRVSTDKNDQLNSLSNQKKYFTDYISSHPGWQLVEIYCDEGISGTNTQKRKNFNRMIADAEKHKIDKILTKEVSRFARNTIDTLKYTRHLKEIGVNVIFIIDNIDTSKGDDEFQLTLMGAIAQKESSKISERIKWGQKRSMENGVVFGRDLLGYTVKNGNLIINTDEAKIVKLIYHKFLNEGKGTHVISQELDNAGIRPKRVKEWSSTVVLRVLRNEKYVGDLLQQKTFTPNYLTHSKKYNHGEVKNVFIKNHHEPIIDRITWDKTQEELKHRSPSDNQKKKYSNRYWCSGKLVCGECSHRFVSRTKKLKTGGIYKSWRCCSAAKHGLPKIDNFGNQIGCDNSSINDKTLLACAGYVINNIQCDRKKLVLDIINDIKTIQITDNKVDTNPLKTKINDIDNKKEKAIDLKLEGTITESELKKQLKFYNKEISILNIEIDKANIYNINYQKQKNGIQKYISEIKSIIGFNTESGLLYRELIDKIEIYKNNYVVVYLNCIPFGVKLNYHTTGRKSSYSISIDSGKIVCSSHSP